MNNSGHTVWNWEHEQNMSHFSCLIKWTQNFDSVKKRRVRGREVLFKFGGYFMFIRCSHFPLWFSVQSSLFVLYLVLVEIRLYCIWLFCSSSLRWYGHFPLVGTKVQRESAPNEARSSAQKQSEKLQIKTERLLPYASHKFKVDTSPKNNKYRTYYKYLMENNCSECIFIMRMCSYAFDRDVK